MDTTIGQDSFQEAYVSFLKLMEAYETVNYAGQNITYQWPKRLLIVDLSMMCFYESFVPVTEA